MAKFTATKPISLEGISWGTGGVVPAGQTVRIPDGMATEFDATVAPLIPGFTWIVRDETSALSGFDPTTKYDKTGGTISGAVVATGSISGASLSASGAINGASVSVSGAILGSNATVNLARFKGEPWYDVKAYGATGDGVTDDTTAIQSALNALPSEGGTVFFPHGTYIISSTLTAGTLQVGNIRLVGAGGELSGAASVIQMTGTNKRGITLQAAEAWLEHLAIVGPAVSATAGEGIYATYNVHALGCTFYGFYTGALTNSGGSFYCSFTDCRFQNNTFAGVRVQGFNTTIFNCRTSGGQYGVYCDGGTSLRVESGAVESFTQRGIYLDSALNALIKGIYFESQSSAASSYIYIGPTTTCVATNIIGCLFHAESVTSAFVAIEANIANDTLIQGNFFGKTLGGIFKFSSSTQGVRLGPNSFASNVSIPIDIGTTSAATSLTWEGRSMGASLRGSVVQTVTSSSTILANADRILVQSGGTITVASAPTIADGIDGQMLWITCVNAGGNTVVLQDQGTLASSNLRLTATTVTLGARDTIALQYIASIGDWVQVSGLVNVL